MTTKAARIEVHRIAWDWYRYHVTSPPDVDRMGHGTKAFVYEQVSKALADAGAECRT